MLSKSVRHVRGRQSHSRRRPSTDRIAHQLAAWRSRESADTAFDPRPLPRDGIERDATPPWLRAEADPRWPTHYRPDDGRPTACHIWCVPSGQSTTGNLQDVDCPACIAWLSRE